MLGGLPACVAHLTFEAAVVAVRSASRVDLRPVSACNGASLLTQELTSAFHASDGMHCSLGLSLLLYLRGPAVAMSTFMSTCPMEVVAAGVPGEAEQGHVRPSSGTGAHGLSQQVRF